MQPSPEFILDATALIALVNGEPGAEIVGPMLPHAVISAISFGEVVQRLRRGGMPAKSVTAALQPLLARKPVPFDEQTAYVAASVHERTPGHELSFGDCACLALALMRKAPAVTAEAAWEHLGLEVKVILIRSVTELFPPEAASVPLP